MKKNRRSDTNHLGRNLILGFTVLALLLMVVYEILWMRDGRKQANDAVAEVEEEKEPEKEDRNTKEEKDPTVSAGGPFGIGYCADRSYIDKDLQTFLAYE